MLETSRRHIQNVSVVTVSDFTPAISVAITIAVAIVIDVRDECVMNFGPDILEVRRNTFAH